MEWLYDSTQGLCCSCFESRRNMENKSKLPTFKSKSKTLSITWFKTKTKTLQFQGADTDDFKTYVKDLVKEYVEGMRKNTRNQVGLSSVAKSVEKKIKSNLVKSLH